MEYAISDDETIAKKEEFFEKLGRALTNIGTNREIILLGDLNSHTGNQTNSKLVGPFGEDRINDNGRRLIEICEHNELRIANGFYKHKNVYT